MIMPNAKIGILKSVTLITVIFFLSILTLIITPTPVNAVVTLNANFEDATFDSLTGNGTWEGPTGSYFGKGVYWNHQIVSTPAQGSYSVAIAIGSGSSTAAYLFTYVQGASNTGYATYSADFYIPSEVTPSDWWNVWQWKSSDTTYAKPIIDLNLVELDGTFQLRMTHVEEGLATNPAVAYTQTVPIAFPRDTWVTVKGEYEARSDSTGEVTIYQDDVEVFNLDNIVTKPGGEIVFWSVNSYADEISPDPATVYIDNMIVDEVDGFGSEPDPDPTCGDSTLDTGEQCELGDPDGYQCIWSECNQTTCVCPEVEPDPNDDDNDEEENTVTNDNTESNENDTSTTLPQTEISNKNILIGTIFILLGLIIFPRNIINVIRIRFKISNPRRKNFEKRFN